MAVAAAQPSPYQELPRAAFALRASDAPVPISEDQAEFDMLAYSGDIMQHYLFGKLAVDLDTLQIGRQVKPVLCEHDRSRIAGFSKSIVNNQAGLRVKGHVLRSTPDGQQVYDLAKQGFPWQASVYVPPDTVEYLSEKDVVQVNGRTMRGPGAIFRNSHLLEVSVCVLGNDEKTSTALLSKGDTVRVQTIGGQTMAESTVTADAQPVVAASPIPAPDPAQSVMDRFSALDAKFSDKGFVLEQFKVGATVGEAQVAWDKRELEQLRAATAALKSENDQLKAAAVKPAAGTTPAAFGAGNTGTDASATKTFLQEVEAYELAHNCRRWEAMSVVARSNPELYRQHKQALPRVEVKEPV